MAVFVISAALTSCDKNKEDDTDIGGGGNGGGSGNSFTIKADNIRNSISSIATAYAYVGGEEDGKVLASTKYQNDSFSLTLPNSVDNKYLISVADWMDDGFDEGWISNNNAKMAIVYLFAWDNDKEWIGEFWHDAVNDNDTKSVGVYYLYIDREVTLKGEKETENGHIFSIDCSFTKGWNTMYDVETTMNNGKWHYEKTTQKPTGVAWYWYFSNWSKIPENKRF